jgi:uncharacterized membrane protein YphA (DoxX/SURF4 family)
MNIALWIIQVLLALLFLFAGGMKLIIAPDELAKMGSPNQVHLPGLLVQFIGLCEVLGGLGLLLPGLVRIRRGLTPLAAVGLLIIMIGAVVLTVIGDGVAAAIVPCLAALLLALIAYGRRSWFTD